MLHPIKYLAPLSLLLLLLAACGGGSESAVEAMPQTRVETVRATLTARQISAPIATKAIFTPAPLGIAADSALEKSADGTINAAASSNDQTADARNKEQAVLRLINRERAAANLPPLSPSPLLTQAAQRHVQDMAQNGVTSHTGSDRSGYGERIRRVGYGGQRVDEAINLGLPSAEAAVDWWLADDFYRNLLLSPRYADIGISYTHVPGTQWQHYWTLTFGTTEIETEIEIVAAEGNVNAEVSIALADIEEASADLAAPASLDTDAAIVSAAAVETGVEEVTVVAAAVLVEKIVEEIVEEAVAETVPEVVAEVAAGAIDEAIVATEGLGCPATSTRQYETIPMENVDLNHPDYLHGDLNLALRGYQPASAQLTLIDVDGAADGDAPKLNGIFADGRLPHFSGSYATRRWDWGCSEHGCATDLITRRQVTLLGMATTAGEEIRPASRNAQIFGGGYVAAVLYAEPTRLTLAYTRDGTVAHGYALHLENFCVDPNLVAAYQSGNAGGRSNLPAVRNGEALGTATGGELIVAVRDRGRFLDPRSRKDWWR